jgi:hypothetical protein
MCSSYTCFIDLSRGAYRPSAHLVFPHVVLMRNGRYREAGTQFCEESSPEKWYSTAVRSNVRPGLRLNGRRDQETSGNGI